MAGTGADTLEVGPPDRLVITPGPPAPAPTPAPNPPPNPSYTVRGNDGADLLRAQGSVNTTMDGGGGPDTSLPAMSGAAARASIATLIALLAEALTGERDQFAITCGPALDTVTPDLRSGCAAAGGLAENATTIGAQAIGHGAALVAGSPRRTG